MYGGDAQSGNSQDANTQRERARGNHSDIAGM